MNKVYYERFNDDENLNDWRGNRIKGKKSAKENLCVWLEKNRNVKVIAITSGGYNLGEWFTIFYKKTWGW